MIMSKIIKSTAILFILTIISKVIGFCRETILVSTYGASMISDVYITSMKIPMTLFAIIASAVATTFIPKFYEVEKNEGSECALAFSNNCYNSKSFIIYIRICVCRTFSKAICNGFYRGKV